MLDFRSPQTYLAAVGCLLLVAAGNFGPIYDRPERPPEMPVVERKFANQEIAVSTGLSRDDIGALDCSQRDTNDTLRGLCLVQDVQRTWNFTEPMCGLRNHQPVREEPLPNPDPRIIITDMATYAEYGEYPWYIMIMSRFNISEIPWQVICSGSLLTWNRGLSAAHCCDSIAEWGGFNRIVIHIGSYLNRHQFILTYDQIRPLTDCVKHPDFQYNRYADIAMLKWEEPVKLKYSSAPENRILVNTLCLAPEPFSWDQLNNVWQENHGNGAYRLTPGIDPPRYEIPWSLRRVPRWISETNLNICSRTLLNHGYELRDDFYYHCRTERNNGSACYGDSGSALSRVGLPGADHTVTGRSFQVGLVKEGENHQICELTYAGGFVRVTSFKDFILEHV